MLCYGAYLSYSILSDDIETRIHRINMHKSALAGHWSAGLPVPDKLDRWTDAFVGNIRVGAPGLLCLFTAPLAWGMLLYHMYLLWAGTTTNESFKWDDWKEDVSDGYVYKCDKPRCLQHSQPDRTVEPPVSWPSSSSQRVVSRSNDASLKAEQGSNFMEPPWTQVHSMREIVNIYDLGFWTNVSDIFPGR